MCDTNSWVIILHGGPGVSGGMGPLVQALADRFRVLTPTQRTSGVEPLTVSRHVEDLDDLVRAQSDVSRPVLVGFSWGAMLALAYAAAHPENVGPIVLVSCGTFDRAARQRLNELLHDRMTDNLRRQLEQLPRNVTDPDERLASMGNLLLPLYSYELMAAPEDLRCDARAHRETWEDMVRLQDEGVYPSAFARIESPVLMLHGATDPHHGRMIRDSLAPFLRRLEYVELERCGHYPWLEKHARVEFFSVLRDWLDRKLRDAADPIIDRNG